MKETVFYLEGRGGMYLYHFFIYNLGGLYYILNKNYNNRGSFDTSVLLDDKSKIVAMPSTTIKFPIKIYMKEVLPFQREAFAIIKHYFELVEDLSKIEDYEIISIYGEKCYISPYGDNIEIIFPFIRILFLEKFHKYEMIKGKKIFITRKGSQRQHGGILLRSILNEKTLMVMLQKYNFEYIQLEEYTTDEKIKLFMQSEVIVSPSSSALTLLLFANKNSKIIEINNTGTEGVPHFHYSEISRILGLNYNRYTNIIQDGYGNFNINTEDFEQYLLTLL